MLLKMCTGGVKSLLRAVPSKACRQLRWHKLYSRDEMIKGGEDTWYGPGWSSESQGGCIGVIRYSNDYSDFSLVGTSLNISP